MTEMPKGVTLKAKNLSKAITVEVHVKGYKGWMFRLKTALFLIRLASYISGLKVNIVH